MEPWTFSRCTLDRVIDGDSMRIIVDTGFYHTANVHVRLLGVDTPERGRDPEKWRTAMQFAEKWFADAGKFSFECHGPDKYGGRWLGKIINRKGESLAQALIDSGHGAMYDGCGQRTGAMAMPHV